MRTVELAQITIPPDRQRKEGKASKDLATLKRGILSKGLLHPPVLRADFTLCAGERRVLAITELHQEGLVFKFENDLVPVGTTPYTLISELDAADFEEAELEENVLRMALTWPESSAAKLRIHEMRKLTNPDQTIEDTAIEIAAHTDREVSTEQKQITMAKMVQPHLSKPSVKAAATLEKAYDIVLQQKKANLLRDLHKLEPKATKHSVIHGDCREVMKTLQKNSFDLICSDPPYGIGADKMLSSTRHEYDDSKENALALYRELFRTGFQLLKPQGIIFLFCDIDHFVTIRTFAEQQAFSTFRTPILWHKGNEGHKPWGRNGPTRTYECILYAVKGQKPLALDPGPDVKTIKRSTKADKSHGAEKPPELLRWLLEISTQRGDFVLDPCCGSGPIITAASGLDLSITAIELNEDYHAKAVARLSEEPQEVASAVTRPATLEDTEDALFGDL